MGGGGPFDDAMEFGLATSLTFFRRAAIEGTGGVGRPGSDGALPIGGFGAPDVGGRGAEAIVSESERYDALEVASERNALEGIAVGDIVQAQGGKTEKSEENGKGGYYRLCQHRRHAFGALACLPQRVHLVEGRHQGSH